MEVGEARVHAEYFGQRLGQYKAGFTSFNFQPTLRGAQDLIGSPSLLSQEQFSAGLSTLAEMFQSPQFDWSHASRLSVSSFVL